MHTTRKLGIINAGGDCAGLNAVIAAVVKSGLSKGYEFIGFERGWEGVLTPLLHRQLDAQAVQNISYLGGTILRTTNKGRFGGKSGTGDPNKIPDEILDEARQHLDELGVEGLILIGGDGTMSAGTQLAAKGVHIVGVPKTIDNDLSNTDRTFGFSTAVGVAVDAIDKIQTTAFSHDRVIFVECMGRYTGWITLFAGLAGGADAILLPEFPVETTSLIEYLRERREKHKYAAVIVVAEGFRLDNQLIKNNIGTSTEVTLGGVSVQLMHQINVLAPGEFEMRNVVLGHVQRGGSPNADDRILAKAYGVAAMEAYDKEKYDTLVCLRGDKMTTVFLTDSIAELKKVSPETQEYKTAKKLGVFMG